MIKLLRMILYKDPKVSWANMEVITETLSERWGRNKWMISLNTMHLINSDPHVRIKRIAIKQLFPTLRMKMDNTKLYLIKLMNFWHNAVDRVAGRKGIRLLIKYPLDQDKLIKINRLQLLKNHTRTSNSSIQMTRLLEK